MARDTTGFVPLVTLINRSSHISNETSWKGGAGCTTSLQDASMRAGFGRQANGGVWLWDLRTSECRKRMSVTLWYIVRDESDVIAGDTRVRRMGHACTRVLQRERV